LKRYARWLQNMGAATLRYHAGSPSSPADVGRSVQIVLVVVWF